MADEQKPVVVKYGGVDYPIAEEFTEREMFDAERLSGQSLDALGRYSVGVLLGYFTLRRAGVDMTFDAFLDSSGFEFEEVDVPLESASATASDSSSGGDPTESDGTPASPQSSESTPG